MCITIFLCILNIEHFTYIFSQLKKIYKEFFSSVPHNPELATRPAQSVSRHRGRRPGVQVLGPARPREGGAGAQDRHHSPRDHGRSGRARSKCRTLLNTAV
jgi:hypothetical protein